LKKRFGKGPTSAKINLRFLSWVQESSLPFDGSASAPCCGKRRLLVLGASGL